MQPYLFPYLGYYQLVHAVDKFIFFDDVNYINRIPLDMSLEHYHELPEAVRPLLVRAFSYAMLTRWHEADVQARRQ